MNLAKISANGQITVPIEIRKKLSLKSGDKILCIQNKDGEIVISSASSMAIQRAQDAFKGAKDKLGVKNEYDVQEMIDQIRYKR